MKFIKSFLFIIVVFSFFSFYKNMIQNDTVFNDIIYNNIKSSSKTNNLLKIMTKNTLKENTNYPVSLLNNSENLAIAPVLYVFNEPIIYIYNTHDQEKYSDGFTIKEVSYLLQEELESYGIASLVEERSPTEAIKKNRLEYKYTYDFSFEYANDVKNKYPSIVYYIDVHRDGVDKNISTTTINNKSYAKLMFFLGTKHDKSEENKALVKKLEAFLEKNYSSILRNTYIVTTSSYNQEISPNSFLIEVGGNQNTKEEVINSTKAFAKALANYVGEVSIGEIYE